MVKPARGAKAAAPKVAKSAAPKPAKTAVSKAAESKSAQGRKTTNKPKAGRAKPVTGLRSDLLATS